MLWSGSFLVVVIAGWALFSYLAKGLPSLDNLEEYTPKLASKVYSADGKLIHTFHKERRTYVPITEMPPHIWKALVSIEDRRFFKHWGLDPIRIVKAIIVDIMAFELVEGASTITQQLARQLYMNQSLQQTFTRKLREQITSIEIERTYTKTEILDLYLNYMNFGHGSYGVESAARFYFAKDARDLNLQECAMLAGVLNRPASLSPYVNPDRARNRRNLVLYSMLQTEMITRAEYDVAVDAPLGVLPEKPKPNDGLGGYFIEHIRQDLQKKLGMELYDGGYEIHTTLDSRAQFLAEKYADEQIDVMQRRNNKRILKNRRELQKLITQKTLEKVGKTFNQIVADSALVDSLLTEIVPVQAALVSINPSNGHVVAMIGGRDFSKYKFNRAIQAQRQPGSAFKPFLYTAVIDNGYPATLELLNQPVVVFLESGQRWSPHNYGETMGGLTTIREGLKKSLNLISVRLIQNITNPRTVIRYAKELGLTTRIPEVDAIALGSGSVIPLEITQAYAAFANQGILKESIFVTQIKDRYGNVIEENFADSRQAIKKETAFVVTDLLRGVVDGGTGGRTRWMYKFYRPAAGKTGTTNDYTDAWFVGFTPQIATGVWVGFDNPAQTFGPGQDGARVALPIWAPYMKSVHDSLALPEEDFIMPETVLRLEICNASKKLANNECPGNLVFKEVFIMETEPTQNCDVHTGFRRDSSRKRRIR